MRRTCDSAERQHGQSSRRAEQIRKGTGKVKIGTSVNVIGNSGGWLHVETETNQGYMMEEFVDVGISKTETPTVSELAERIEKLEERVTALEGGVG